jgi:frataxin-like iron-binding protein CyaY
MATALIPSVFENHSSKMSQLPVPISRNNIQMINIDALLARQFSTATRRKRRGSARSPTFEDSQSNTSVLTVDNLSHNEQFQTAANHLFDKIETSIEKLKGCNDGLDIERSGPYVDNTVNTQEEERNKSHEGQIAIHIPPSGDTFWGGGTYTLTIHFGSIDGVDGVHSGYVSMQSPLSGTFTYIYNVRTREWEGTEDGHSLLGMFTRDFIRQCRGVPDF